MSGEKCSNGVKNKISTLLEHCLARICQTSIMLEELEQTVTCDEAMHIVF